jgi:acetyl esterase/lipase
LISPVLGDLRGLPPLLGHAGEDEILRDDALRIEKLAKAAGVDVRLKIYPRIVAALSNLATGCSIAGRHCPIL